ncbi:hypothetical protein [Streptomyces luteireticuli]|uniref:Uncharacterized protein n=1 Tax=Streptomyces luteireticuli TaxID=173858 RepID=A0ABP3I3F7_9ACTN
MSRPQAMSGRYSTLDHPGARWLVSRAVRPREIHEAWAMGRTPSIEVGRRFDVIHLSAKAVEDRILGTRTDEAIEGAFRAVGIGQGVIVSRQRDVHSVLVRAGTARTWDAPGTSAVGVDDHLRYLRVPHPGRREGPGAFWLLPVTERDEALATAGQVHALTAPPERSRITWGFTSPSSRHVAPTEAPHATTTSLERVQKQVYSHSRQQLLNTFKKE